MRVFFVIFFLFLFFHFLFHAVQVFPMAKAWYTFGAAVLDRFPRAPGEEAFLEVPKPTSYAVERLFSDFVFFF